MASGSPRLEVLGDPPLRVPPPEARVAAGAHEFSVPEVGKLCLLGSLRLDHRHDGQRIAPGELEVAFVMRGHGHDRAGPVAGEDIVCDPNGDPCAVQGIERVGAGEHAGLLLREVRSLQVALGGGLPAVVVDLRPQPGIGQRVDERVFRRKDHVGAAEQRVRPGGENLEAADSGFLQSEGDFSALAPADPGRLHPLRRVGPVESFQPRQEPVRIGGYPEHPLPEVAPLDGKAADLALAVDDLLVREDGPQLRAPPDRPFVDKGEPPLEQLQEDPLGPPEVPRVGRVDLALPVIGKAERPDLALEVFDVVLGGSRRERVPVLTACCSAGRPG